MHFKPAYALEIDITNAFHTCFYALEIDIFPKIFCIHPTLWSDSTELFSSSQSIHHSFIEPVKIVAVISPTLLMTQIIQMYQEAIRVSDCKSNRLYQYLIQRTNEEPSSRIVIGPRCDNLCRQTTSTQIHLSKTK